MFLDRETEIEMRKRIFFVASVILLVLGVASAIMLNSNYYYSKKLCQAIKSEDLDTVKQILEKKPSCINTFPAILPRSVLYGVFDLNRVLYPLNEACLTGNFEMVKLLVYSNADVNCNDGFTPLSIAYSSKPDNWYQISLFLIENSASLDYATEYSGDASAILQDIVSTRGGAALPGYIPDNETEVIAAFHYAIAHCDRSKVKWMRVLQHSITNNRIEIVRFLLDENYCDVNDTSIGMTALMFAAQNSTLEMVELLLEKGADKGYISPEGTTAYEYAIRFQPENEEVIAILRN